MAVGKLTQILVTAPDVYVLVHARSFRLGRREYGIWNAALERGCLGQGLCEAVARRGPGRTQGCDCTRQVEACSLDRSLAVAGGFRRSGLIRGDDLR